MCLDVVHIYSRISGDSVRAEKTVADPLFLVRLDLVLILNVN